MSHGRERPCSLAFCGHHAVQFTKCHTTAMSLSVLESIFPVWLQMLVPMSHSKFEASALPFPKQIALGWNWPPRVEMQQGMVGGRVGFLVARLWEGVRGMIEKVIFRPAILLHVAVQCRFTSLLLLCSFCYFGWSQEVSHITRFHSFFEKLPLVNMSASWFLVSTYLIWSSKLILSNNQSSATLWVLDTCLIVGLGHFNIILITASLSSKMYN